LITKSQVYVDHYVSSDDALITDNTTLTETIGTGWHTQKEYTQNLFIHPSSSFKITYEHKTNNTGSSQTCQVQILYNGTVLDTQNETGGVWTERNYVLTGQDFSIGDVITIKMRGFNGSGSVSIKNVVFKGTQSPHMLSDDGS